MITGVIKIIEVWLIYFIWSLLASSSWKKVTYIPQETSPTFQRILFDHLRPPPHKTVLVFLLVLVILLVGRLLNVVLRNIIISIKNNRIKKSNARILILRIKKITARRTLSLRAVRITSRSSSCFLYLFLRSFSCCLITSCLQKYNFISAIRIVNLNLYFLLKSDCIKN